MLQAGGYIHSCSNVCCYLNIVVNESEECEIERRVAERRLSKKWLVWCHMVWRTIQLYFSRDRLEVIYMENTNLLKGGSAAWRNRVDGSGRTTRADAIYCLQRNCIECAIG